MEGKWRGGSAFSLITSQINPDGTFPLPPDIHLEKSPFIVFGKFRVRVERDQTNPVLGALQGASPFPVLCFFSSMEKLCSIHKIHGAPDANLPHQQGGLPVLLLPLEFEEACVIFKQFDLKTNTSWWRLLPGSIPCFFVCWKAFALLFLQTYFFFQSKQKPPFFFEA